MRWALAILFVSIFLVHVLAQDSTEDSPAPKRVLKKYRVRRPIVVDDQGNVVRAGPRLRRVQVKRPRPGVETAALEGNPPQRIPVASPSPSAQPVVISSNPPPRVRAKVAKSTVATVTASPAPVPVAIAQPQQQPRTLQVQQPRRQPEQIFIDDAPQAIEQVRTVPTYRQATPTASREALLANVNYKSRGASPIQALGDDDEEGSQKVGTIRNYSHINEDGSFTFGYEAADGSFKEETRGIDCVVKGKYGYVDPDGVRREFEYVSGNPCDPNAPKEEEALDDEEEDERAAPPSRPLLRRVRPEISENNLQGLQQVREEALNEDQLNQFVRPRQRVVRPTQPSPSPRPRIRITSAPPTLPSYTASPALIIRERPVSVRPTVFQEPSQSLDSDRGSRAFNFDSEFQRIAQQISRPISQPQPLYEQPLQVVQRHPTPTVATQPARQAFGNVAALRSFNSPTAASPSGQSPTAGPTVASGERNPSFGRYRTELVYDPQSGQYTSVVVQAMPNSNQEIELTQKLRAFVEPQRPNQVNFQNFGQPQIQYFTNSSPSPQGQGPTVPSQPHQNPNQIDQFLARNAYAQQRYVAQQQQPQQQPQQQQQISNFQFIPPHLRPQPSPSSAPQSAPSSAQHVQPQLEQQRQEYQFTAPTQHLDSRNPANGQIDAFLRALNINI